MIIFLILVAIVLIAYLWDTRPSSKEWKLGGGDTDFGGGNEDGSD